MSQAEGGRSADRRQRRGLLGSNWETPDQCQLLPSWTPPLAPFIIRGLVRCHYAAGRSGPLADDGWSSGRLGSGSMLPVSLLVPPLYKKTQHKSQKCKCGEFSGGGEGPVETDRLYRLQFWFRQNIRFPGTLWLSVAVWIMPVVL